MDRNKHISKFREGGFFNGLKSFALLEIELVDKCASKRRQMSAAPKFLP